MNGKELDWFPKPNNKIITFKEAVKNIKINSIPPPLSPCFIKWVPLMNQGQSVAEVSKQNKHFQTVRIFDNKVCPTITKVIGGIGFGSLIHPFENRVLSISEIKRCCTFPDDWKLGNKYSESKARMGNAVMPKMMEAIAKHINQTFLKKDNPTVISTFCGTGGSSLGYKYAGYKELLAIDWENHAVQCFKANFPEVPCQQKDITKVTSQEIFDFCKITKGELDVFDGSPPCQGFSTAGKRQVSDERNDLFKHYWRLVKEIQPKVFVMENVSGMIKGKMKGKFKEIMSTLKSDNYEVKCKLMNAMYYNVPQSRQRLIFIGVRKDILEKLT
jgi:site-specific DNA-cytosine methylase